MTNECDRIQPLMSGYLDGEADETDRGALERHLASCEKCRLEFDAMKRLVAASSALRVTGPPDEVWDTFLEGVYNRIERRTGWAVLAVGLAALAFYGVYLFVSQPWGSALAKLVVAAPVTGLAILFVSVLRQRLAMARVDRYSREVQR